MSKLFITQSTNFYALQMLLVSFQKNPFNFEVLFNFCNTEFDAEELVIMYLAPCWGMISYHLSVTDF